MLRIIFQTTHNKFICQYYTRHVSITASSPVIHLSMSMSFTEPPVVSELPPSLVIPSGSPLELRCSAAGRPEPQLSWQLEGVPLPTERSGEVTVPSAGLQHMGLYSCLAWNEVGSDRKDVFVAVVGKLRAPGRSSSHVGSWFSVLITFVSNKRTDV